MRKRPKKRNKHHRLSKKPPQSRATKATWITKEEEELEQEKAKRKSKRTVRNKDDMTTNYDALGNSLGRITSNPYGQKTRVNIKVKRYKTFSKT